MRFGAFALAILLLGGVLPVGVIAHEEGPGHTDATVPLAAAGSPGAMWEATLADLNLTASPGDTLRFAWSVDSGQGPAVYFEIHSHPPGRYEQHYTVTATTDEGAWVVPGSETYWVLFRNFSNVSVEVAYSFEILPGTASEVPWTHYLLAVGVVAGGVAVAGIALRRRGDTESETEEPSPDEGD